MHYMYIIQSCAKFNVTMQGHLYMLHPISAMQSVLNVLSNLMRALTPEDNSVDLHLHKLLLAEKKNVLNF